MVIPGAIAQPEHELLLLCARTRFEAEVSASIGTLLQQELDWNYLLETAAAHSVLPLLFNGINATPNSVPKPVMAQLRQRFQANAFHNLFLTNELLKVLKLFQEQQIEVVPYKGPILAALHYGNSALRTFCDLDIIVRQQDVPRAKELLLAHGYRRIVQLTADQEARLLELEYEYKFVRQDGKVALLELHWSNAASYSPFRIDVESLWERAEAVAFHGITFAQFQPEDLLILLCIHGAKDQWRELKWICDVHELCSAQIDWRTTQQRASDLGVQRLLTLGVLLAHKCLGTRLPPELLDEDAIASSIAEHIQVRLFASENYRLIERWILAMARMGDTLPEKWRYLSPMLVPNERDFAVLALPQSLSFLYYLIRPLRILARYGGGRLSRLIKKIVATAR